MMAKQEHHHKHALCDVCTLDAQEIVHLDEQARLGLELAESVIHEWNRGAMRLLSPRLLDIANKLKRLAGENDA